MSRNRRNKRKLRDSINIETLSNKNFIITSIVFLVIIVLCITILSFRSYQDKLEIAIQKEILDKQIKAIFEDKRTVSYLDETTSEVNENEKEITSVNEQKEETEVKQTQVIKQDTIVNVAVTGDILCNNEMLKDAKSGDKYDFSHMFTGIENLVKSSDITIGTMETNFVENKK